MTENGRKRSKSEGKTNSSNGREIAGSTRSSRADPDTFSRGSPSSGAGTRAGLRDGSSGRAGGASGGSGGAAQAGLGSGAATGAAARGGMTSGDAHPAGLQHPLPGLLLHRAPQHIQHVLKQDPTLPPGLILKLQEEKRLPTCLHFHVPPQTEHSQSLPEQPQPRASPG